MRPKSIEYANLVITAGDKYFLDLLKHDFWPSIQHGTEVDGHGEVNTYIFRDTGITSLEGHPFIYGRLVKEMTLNAEQKLDHKQDRLVPSNEAIESAPSSIFVITLADHKLIFSPETSARAPQVRDFQYCLRYLLETKCRADRREYINEKLKANSLTRIPYGDKSEWYLEVDKKFPMPQVDIRTFPSSFSIKEKLARFSRITAVQIKTLKKNREYSKEDAEFLKKLEAEETAIHATESSAVFRNPKESLDKPSASRLIETANDGNHAVSFSGYSEDGTKLTANLEQLKFKDYYAPEKGQSLIQRAASLIGKYKTAITSKVISIGLPDAGMLEKAKKLYKELSE